MSARPAEPVEDREVTPPEDPHALVGPVDQVEQALLRIPGELQAEAAARSAGLRADEALHQVFPVLPERLDTVAPAVGDVDQPILRTHDAVQRRVLLRRGIRFHGILVPLRVYRLLAVRSPVAD